MSLGLSPLWQWHRTDVGEASLPCHFNSGGPDYMRILQGLLQA
jgi:hypothetical protein